MRARQIIAMFILVAIGIPVASSHAKLPKTKSKTIVVNKSIGGVKIGTKLKTVKKKWGKSKGCGAKYTFGCDWLGTRTQGSAGIIHLDGKVRSLEIKLGVDNANQIVFSSPLMKFKTNKGIGLGSTEAEVRAAYPAAVNTAADVLTYGTPGKIRTGFGIYAGRVSEISISK
jgi:hypothetical protein